jgi:hypothetical protein
MSVSTPSQEMRHWMRAAQGKELRYPFAATILALPES